MGNIIVGKINLTEIDKLDYLSSVSYTDTDLFIMNDSVFNNVTLFDPAYTVDEVVQSLNKLKSITPFPSYLMVLITFWPPMVQIYPVDRNNEFNWLEHFKKTFIDNNGRKHERWTMKLKEMF